MAVSQTVTFKALADFSSLRRAAARARRELEALRREALKSNADLTASGRAQESQNNRTARSLGELSRKHRESATSTREHGTATQNVNRELGNLSSAHQRAGFAADQQAVSTRALADADRDLANAEREQRAAADNLILTRQRLVQVQQSSTATVGDLADAERDHANASQRLADANERLNVTTQTTIVRQRELGNETRSSGGGILDLFGKLGTLRGGFRAIGSAVKVMLLPAAVQGIQALAAAATYAAGALVALASAISPVIGLLGAIPGAAIAAGSAILTVVLGFRGVIDAIKAGSKEDARGGAAAKKAGDQRAQAAKRSADAQRNLARAHVQAARQIEQAERGVQDALRGVADAERALARAQVQAREAQEDLNRARREAIEDLEDMRRAVQRAHLSEERAVIALEEARERLDELNQAREEGSRAAADLSGYTDDEIAAMKEAGVVFEDTAEERRNLDRERKKAALDVRDAELSLVEAQDRVGDSQRELTRQFAGGIETSDRVTQAREALASANESVADSERSLADAQRGVADAQRALAEAHSQAAEQIADAQRAVAEAMESAGEAAAGASGGVDKFAEAMAKLSPAGRSFVNFVLNEVLPAFRALSHEIQEVLLPRLERAGRTLLTLIPTITPGLKSMAAALGDVAIAGANMVTSGPWRADIQTLMGDAAGHMRTFGAVTLLVADGLRHVAIAARPLVDALGQIALKLAAQFQAWAQAGRESGRLAAFFERVAWVTDQLIQLFGNIIGILLNVGRAARDVGDNYLSRLVEWTERWQQRTAEGTDTFGRMRQFFEDTRPVVDAIILVFQRFIEAWSAMVQQVKGETGSFPFVENLKFFADNIVPALVRFIGSLDQDFLPALLRLAEAALNLASTFGPFTAALTAFANTLTPILNAFNWLLTNIPGLKELLGGLLAAFGAYKAVQFVTGTIGLFVSAITGMGGAAKLVGPIMSSAAATTVAGWVAMAVAAVAKAAVIAASWLLAFWPVALVIAIVAGLVFLIVKYWDEIKAAIGAGWDWVKEKTSAVWNWIKDHLNIIIPIIVGIVTGPLGALVALIIMNWDKVKEWTGKAWDWVRDKLAAVWNWIKDTASKVWNGLVDTVKGAIDRVKNFVGDLVEAGKELIRGIWRGISSLGGWLWDQVTGFIRRYIIDPAKSLLGLTSPSKLFAAFGRDIVRGLNQGIADLVPQAVGASVDLVNAVTGSFDVRHGVVDRALNVSVTNHIDGARYGDAGDLAAAIAQQVEAAVERLTRAGRQGRK